MPLPNENTFNMLVDLLVEHEGSVKEDGVHVPYEDSVGVLTIGYGRNLEARGLTEEEAQYLLEGDAEEFFDRLLQRFPIVEDLSEVRQIALADMAFNLGLHGISQFVNMWAAIEDGDYERAAEEMLNSRWAEQVKTRADDLAFMMESNELPFWV